MKHVIIKKTTSKVGTQVLHKYPWSILACDTVSLVTAARWLQVAFWVVWLLVTPDLGWMSPLVPSVNPLCPT